MRTKDVHQPGAKAIADVVMPFRLELLTDKAGPADEGAPVALMRFRAVGAVADAVYQSGRVILSEAQRRAVKASLDSKRQMTTYVGHPGVETEEDMKHVGKLDDVAGVVRRYHYDNKSKQTVLDEVAILDTPKGRVAADLLRGGVALGISQRAMGTQEMREWDDGGEKRQAAVVTDLRVYGWDLVHLPDSNAGNVTEVMPLADSVAASLASGVDLGADWGTPSGLDLLDSELEEFAPLGAVPVVDGAVKVHAPEKADMSQAWNPSQAEVNKLPDSAFAWLSPEYVSGESKDRGEGRKLPHHLPNGRTVFRGVRAALAVLNGARGGLKIAEADRKGVYAHLSAHYRQFGQEAPVLRDTADLPETAKQRVLQENHTTARDSVPGAGTESDMKVQVAATGAPAVDSALGNKLADSTLLLADSVRTMLKTMEAQLNDRAPAPLTAGVNDSLAGRYNAEESTSALWQGAMRAVRLACSELDAIVSDVNMAVADKNTKLTKMGVDLKGLFAKMTDGFVSANKQSEASNESAAASGATAGTTVDSAAVAAAPVVTPPVPVAAPVVKDSASAAVAAVPVVPAYVAPAPAVAATTPAVAATTPAVVVPPVVTTDSAAAAVAALVVPAYVPPPAPTPTPTPAQVVVVEDANKVSATQALADSINAMVEDGKLRKKLADNTQYAQDAVKRQRLSDSVEKDVLAMVLKGVTSGTKQDDIEDSVKTALRLVSLGQSKERLDSMGLNTNRGEGTQMISNVTDVHSLGAPHLSGVKLLADSFAASGHFRMAHPETQKMPPALQKLVKRFDDHFAPELRREKAQLDSLQAHLKESGRSLTDATVGADIDMPHTISRLILQEAYAADIIRAISDFGTMDNFRDQVPITRWRQESGAALVPTFKPSVFQRASVKVGELGAIPRGRLQTEFFPIDAVARKMGATMSDEFLTRAKRRPDISGQAMAVNNLIEDVKRCIQQDIYYEHIRAALFNGSAAFDVLATGNAVLTTFQVVGTTPANAVSIVPNDPRSPLIVEVGSTSGNRAAVPEFGTTTVGGGFGGTFFYVINHSLSLISFVDANGAALAPAASANNIRFRGFQASGEVRFNMNLPVGVSQEQHMLSLLFAVANQRARNSSGGISADGFYDSDILLTSVVNAEFLKQASAYKALDKRTGYSGDAPLTDGSYGVTAGLNHWGSKVFMDDFMVVADSKAVLFRQYEPLNLRGPIEGRSSTGQLNGSKEWYTYQEDSIATPIPQKCAVITLYRA